MGRSKKSTVVLRNKYVSAKHCEATYEAGEYTLIDLDSTNGLFVNGNKIKSHRLEDGDKILAGTALMLFVADEDAFESEQFIEQLDSGSKEERELAAGLLGQLGSTDVGDPLIQALEYDLEPTVKAAAAEALGLVGDSRAVQALLAHFGTSNPVLRNAVVAAITRLADAKAIKGLVGYLKHEDQRVRVLAAHTLGRIHSKTATEQLIKALDDDAFVVREAVVKALGDLGDPRAAAALMRAAADPQKFPQVWVIESLGKIRSPESTRIVLTAMASHDAEVREAAANALSKLRSKEAAPALIEALDDNNAKVRTSAAEALEKLRIQLEMTEKLRRSSASGKKTIEISALGDSEDDGIRKKPKFGEDRSKWETWWAKHA